MDPPSPSDVGEGIHSSQMLHEDDSSGAERWRQGDVETSVTIEKGWGIAIQCQTLVFLGEKWEISQKRCLACGFHLLYSAYILQVFNFANFVNLELLAKFIQLKFQPLHCNTHGQHEFAKFFQQIPSKQLFAKI